MAVVFEGAAARSLLPHLLGLLDGTRTTDEVVAAVGPAVEPATRAALERLASHDLLADGPRLDRARATRRSRSGSARRAAHRRPWSPTASRRRRSTSSAREPWRPRSGPSSPLPASDASPGPRGSARPGEAGLVVVAPAPHELPRLAEWNELALARSRDLAPGAAAERPLRRGRAACSFPARPPAVAASSCGALRTSSTAPSSSTSSRRRRRIPSPRRSRRPRRADGVPRAAVGAGRRPRPRRRLLRARARACARADLPPRLPRPPVPGLLADRHRRPAVALVRCSRCDRLSGPRRLSGPALSKPTKAGWRGCCSFVSPYTGVVQTDGRLPARARRRAAPRRRVSRRRRRPRPRYDDRRPRRWRGPDAARRLSPRRSAKPLERYAATAPQPHRLVRATAAELGPAAVDPDRFALFHDVQYAARAFRSCGSTRPRRCTGSRAPTSRRGPRVPPGATRVPRAASRRPAAHRADEQRARLRPDADGRHAGRAARGRGAGRVLDRVGEPALAAAARLDRRRGGRGACPRATSSPPGSGSRPSTSARSPASRPRSAWSRARPASSARSASVPAAPRGPSTRGGRRSPRHSPSGAGRGTARSRIPSCPTTPDEVRTFDDHIRWYATPERAERAAFLDPVDGPSPAGGRPRDRGRRRRERLEAICARSASPEPVAYAVDVATDDVAAAACRSFAWSSPSTARSTCCTRRGRSGRVASTRCP